MAERAKLVERELANRGVLTSWHGRNARLVTHLDVTTDGIKSAVAAFAEALRAVPA